jgi:hypothetical protein
MNPAINYFHRLLCTHPSMTVKRAHPDSEYTKENQDYIAWMDRLGVANFIVCARCGQPMFVRMEEHVFEQIPESPMFPLNKAANEYPNNIGSPPIPTETVGDSVTNEGVFIPAHPSTEVFPGPPTTNKEWLHRLKTSGPKETSALLFWGPPEDYQFQDNDIPPPPANPSTEDSQRLDFNMLHPSDIPKPRDIPVPPAIHDTLIPFVDIDLTQTHDIPQETRRPREDQVSPVTTSFTRPHGSGSTK